MFCQCWDPSQSYDNSQRFGARRERDPLQLRPNRIEGRLSQSDMDDRMAKIEPVSTMEAFQNAT